MMLPLVSYEQVAYTRPLAQTSLTRDLRVLYLIPPGRAASWTIPDIVSGYDAQCAGVTNVAHGPGYSHGQLSLRLNATAGAAAKATVEGVTNPSTNAITIMARVKFRTRTGAGVYFANADSPTAALGLVTRSSWFKVEGWGASSAPNVQSAQNPVADRWYTWAYSWDGANGTQYVNGSADGTNATTPQNNTITRCFIGCASLSFSTINGDVEAAGCWNRALTAEEHERLHVSALSGWSEILHLRRNSSARWLIGTETAPGGFKAAWATQRSQIIGGGVR